jgi:ABC-type multidrug transport system ATPase subunit
VERLVIEARDVLVGDQAAPPFSLDLAAGEIVGLLSPRGTSQSVLFRTLAGLDPPRSGKVRLRTDAVALASSGSSFSDVLASRPDVVLVDGLFDELEPRVQRAAWARLVSERDRGAAIVVGTALTEQAYRTDRVSLAMWSRMELVHEFTRLQSTMQERLREFMALVGRSMQEPRNKVTVAAELMRLNRAGRDLVREASRLSKTVDEIRQVRDYGSDFSHSSLSDGVLERLIDRGRHR